MGRNRVMGTRMENATFRLMRCSGCGNLYKDYKPYTPMSVCGSCGSFGRSLSERTRKVEVAPRPEKLI